MMESRQEKRGMKRLQIAIALLALAAGCSRQGGPAPASRDATGPDTAAALVKYNRIVVRREPVDTKNPANHLTMVNRGERVAVLQRDSLWTKIRLSDDMDGWIQSKYLAPADVRIVVMLIPELLVYRRPDPSSPRLANDTIMTRQGIILWITKQKDGFAECLFPHGRSGWIAAGELTTDTAEIAAARLLEQARSLVAENKIDEAAVAYRRIAGQYPSTRLAAVSAEESGIGPGGE